MKNLFQLVILVAAFSTISAQHNQNKNEVFTGAQANKICEGCKTVRYSEKSRTPSFINFGEHSSVKSTDAMLKLRNVLNMSMDENLILYRSEKDILGFVHNRYQQYYKNIKVEMGEYLTHEKDGKLISANGIWLDRVNLSVVPLINEKKALKHAIKHIGAVTYEWEVKEESFEKNTIDDANSAFYPKGELVIIAKNFDFEKHELHLCYKFDVFAHAPMSRNWVYIDAANGEVVATENRIESIDVPATGTTLYSGVKPILTSTIAPGVYQMKETTRGLGIETKNLHNNSYVLSSATSFTNSTTTWNTATNKDNAANDAHWALESVYDYYQTVHGRNSIDNLGMKLTAFVHYGINENNAYHLPDGVLAFGDGTGVAGGFNPLVGSVLVAHEFTHGVTEYSAMLHYGGESGSLNESFSDMLGTCAEFYIAPGTANYLIGDQESVTPGNYIRNMSNPSLKSHPDTYLGTNWYAGLNISTMAHTNAGVQNFWFYLLCNGGIGTNDIANTYTVNAIGMNKMEKIVYRSLTTYLTRFSNFADARVSSIQATEDLYGVCSNEVIEVTNAWYAVGIGSAYSATVTADFVANGVYSCSAPFTVNFKNLSSNDLTNSWNFGDGNTSTNTDASNTYLNPGTYTVQLTSTSPCGVNTKTKNAYITINSPPSPTVTPSSVCGTNTVSLSATGTGTLNWYNTALGGSSINTGPNYTTPVLGLSTNYYVANEVAGTTGTLGAIYSPTATGVYGSVYAQYVNFDILKSCVLKSVKTHAYVSGKRNILIYDGLGNELLNYTINLPIGDATILLNLPLEPGAGYRIGGDTLDFAYQGNPTPYPYSLAGTASITGTTIGNLVYMFFYDWQIETATCVSPRTLVTATIKPTPTITVNSGVICSGQSFTINPSGANTYTYSSGTSVVSPTTNTSYNVTGTSSLGCVGSNTAVSSVTVNGVPSLTAVTNNTLLCDGETATLVASGASTYTWNTSNTNSSIVISPSVTTSYSVNGTDINGCSNSAMITQSVSLCTGLNTISLLESIQIYPNPSNNNINVYLANWNDESTQIQITNALGQVWLCENIKEQQSQFNIENLASGIYLVKISQSEKQHIVKLIKQ